MKVAIPTRGTVVDDHFGHCEKYTIFTIGADNSIESSETLLHLKDVVVSQTLLQY